MPFYENNSLNIFIVGVIASHMNSFLNRPMQMKFFVVAYVLFLSLWPSIAVAAPPSDVLPPRMWMAVSPIGEDGHIATFYILGITHFGLSTEYDDYFEKQVKPAFKKSDTLLFEGAGGREDEPYPVCDSSVLGDEEKRIVDAERIRMSKVVVDSLEAAHIAKNGRAAPDGFTREEFSKAMHIYVNGRDEFQLIELEGTFSDKSIDSSHEEENAKQYFSLKGSVVNALRASRPEILVRDIDTRYGARRAYCNLGKERIQFFKSNTNQSKINSSDVVDKLKSINNSIYNFLSGDEWAPGDILNSLNDLDRTFVCQRNREWIDGMKKMTDGKTYFLAVGFKHLFKIDHGDAHCNGLLFDLKKIGWIVKEVNS